MIAIIHNIFIIHEFHCDINSFQSLINHIVIDATTADFLFNIFMFQFIFITLLLINLIL